MESGAISEEGDNLKPRSENGEFKSRLKLQDSKQIDDLNNRFQTPACHLCLPAGVLNEVLW